MHNFWYKGYQLAGRAQSCITLNDGVASVVLGHSVNILLHIIAICLDFGRLSLLAKNNCTVGTYGSSTKQNYSIVCCLLNFGFCYSMKVAIKLWRYLLDSSTYVICQLFKPLNVFPFDCFNQISGGAFSFSIKLDGRISIIAVRTIT